MKKNFLFFTLLISTMSFSQSVKNDTALYTILESKIFVDFLKNGGGGKLKLNDSAKLDMRFEIADTILNSSHFRTLLKYNCNASTSDTAKYVLQLTKKQKKKSKFPWYTVYITETNEDNVYGCLIVPSFVNNLPFQRIKFGEIHYLAYKIDNDEVCFWMSGIIYN